MSVFHRPNIFFFNYLKNLTWKSKSEEQLWESHTFEMNYYTSWTYKCLKTHQGKCLISLPLMKMGGGLLP